MRLLSCLALGLAISTAASAAPPESRDELVPFVLPWNDGSGGPSSIAEWNHRPAGRFGFIRVGDDGHFHTDQGRIRLLGANVQFGACLPEKDQAEEIAARMAKFGLNVVRFHHMDRARFPRGLLAEDASDTRQLDPRAMERLDYFVAQLKENGIYVNLNLLVSRRFCPEDGLPGTVAEVRGKANHLLGFFYEPAFDLHAEYARKLLTHRNAYTGNRYVEEPAVALVEIINENGLVNYWFDTARKPRLRDLPEPFRTALRQQWNEWLTQRYDDSQALREVWPATTGTEAKATVDLVPYDGFRDRPRQQQRDWLEFLRHLEQRYFHRMVKLLKEDLGLRAPVIGTTCASSLVTVMAAETDVIDGHVYWGNPHWRTHPWDWNSLDWSIDNISQVDCGNPGGRLRWLAMYRVAGMPCTVTEFNEAAPNVFAGEAPLYIATYAALQDWDAVFFHNYEASGSWNTGMLHGNQIGEHPTKMANFPVAAAIFRRGDVQPANQRIAAPMSRDKELQILIDSGSQWSLANGFDLGLDGDNIVRHRIALEVNGSDNADISPGPTLSDFDRLTSDTGEVTWDGSDDQGAVQTVDTDRTKAVFGMTAGREFRMGDVTIEVGQTLDGGATVALTLLEGESFADPGRALLVATARAVNTGMHFRPVTEDVDGKPVTRYEITSWGERPSRVEVVPAVIRVPEHKGLTVYALDERGQRKHAIEVNSASGEAVVQIGPPAATLWYEFVWER
ncbi:MAG: hypothetical protein ACP5HU_01610 [Phycisphaerae bacterium]